MDLLFRIKLRAGLPARAELVPPERLNGVEHAEHVGCGTCNSAPPMPKQSELKGWVQERHTAWSALWAAVAECVGDLYPLEKLYAEWDLHHGVMPRTPIPDPRLFELETASKEIVEQFAGVYKLMYLRWQSRWYGREDQSPSALQLAQRFMATADREVVHRLGCGYACTKINQSYYETGRV